MATVAENSQPLFGYGLGGSKMDIAAMSMAISQMQLQQQVSTSVLKMAMETPEAQLDKLVQTMEASAKAMEQSVTPHLGTNLDVSV